MAPKWRFVALALIFLMSLGVTLVSRDVASAPNDLELVCQVDSVATPLTNNHIVIPIRMTNFTDSVSGYELLVSLEVPEFVSWAVDFDSGGIVKAQYDTVGTRTGGFKFFQTRIQDGMHGLVKVSALCDPDSPRVVKPIPPGNGVLLKLIAQTNGTLGDSLCDSIYIKAAIVDGQTRFSNSASPPEVIGCIYTLEIDTVYTNCAEYQDTTCISWFDTTYEQRYRCTSMDTSQVVLLDGKVTFSCCSSCGDANSDDGIDISDAVYLIQYIFAGGPAPGPCGGSPTGHGDANGDGSVDISDAVFLIQYIFAGGPQPHCP